MDFAGPTMEIIDPLTGIVSKTQVFVVAVGASQLLVHPCRSVAGHRLMAVMPRQGQVNT